MGCGAAGYLALQCGPIMELLATKFYVPPLRPDLVARPQLARRLDEGLQPGRSLTLVSAPAGYGKTTLVVAWLQRAVSEQVSARRARYAWLSLDEDDNDLARFLIYVVAALENGGVPLGPGLRRLLEMAPLPPVATLVTALLNEISQTGDPPLLLVLDDYHRITEPHIHEALQLGLDRAPPGLHLLLLTREDPPLSLSRWRVRNQMVEIRAGDLRFTPAEAAGFLNHTMGLALSAADVAALEQRTEGWIAGLQLAALALQSRETPDARPDAAEFIAAFSGSHHYIIDYLLDEVLRQETADVRDFLQQTAILNHFTVSLCEAVAGRSDAQSLLAYLERRNLFLIPLDSQRRWYRYHHLLADSLQAGLDESRRREGHRRAAAWFASHGYHAEAIDHAAAAGDHDEVARLVRLAAEPAFARGEIRQIAAWLRRLPHKTIVRDPDFGVFWLLSLILSGHSHEAPAAIAALEEHAAGWQNPRQEARLLVIKAWIADISSSPERIDLAQRAAAATRAGDPLFRAFVAVPLGHAYLYQGQLNEAVRVFREGLALDEAQGATFVRVSLLGNLIHALNLTGRHEEAEQVCQQAIAEFIDSHGNPLPPAGLPYLLSAWLHYDASELTAAQQHLALGRDLLQQAYQETMLTPLEVELAAQLHLAAGETGLAWAAINAGLERARRQQYEFGVQAIGRVAAELHLRQGEIAPVRRWVAALPIFAGRQAGGEWESLEPIHDLAYLTYARLLLVEGSQQEAASLLALLASSARAGERGRSLITILLLQSLLATDPGPYMAEALQRAAAGPYRRLILDECAFPAHGPALSDLLRSSAAIAPVFVESVLAALPTGEQATRQPPAAATAAALAEPLTEQELVILRLLAAGLSNRKIAEELVITTGTAKWHVHNIYQKLGVGSRAEAVARIHEWRLLDS
jgi:LuxR family transcriptional regulator, maltose regulon positive regulatory protein